MKWQNKGHTLVQPICTQSMSKTPTHENCRDFDSNPISLPRFQMKLIIAKTSDESIQIQSTRWQRQSSK